MNTLANSPQSKRLIAAAVILVLAVFAWFSFNDARQLQNQLQREGQDLSEMTSKLSEIQQLANAPKVAGFDLESSDRIINRINGALEQAGLNGDMLSNQSPSPPVRQGQSDFTIRTFEIKLKPCTVRQIASFCEALKDPSSGMVVRDLRLFDPQRVAGREIWTSQLTLTQLVYSPKSNA